MRFAEALKAKRLKLLTAGGAVPLPAATSFDVTAVGRGLRLSALGTELELTALTTAGIEGSICVTLSLSRSVTPPYHQIQVNRSEPGGTLHSTLGT